MTHPILFHGQLFHYAIGKRVASFGLTATDLIPSTLADINNAVVWMVCTLRLFSKSSSPCTNLLVTYRAHQLQLILPSLSCFIIFSVLKQSISTYLFFYRFLFNFTLWSARGKVHYSAVLFSFLLLTIIRSGHRYAHVYAHIRGAFSKFPDFFVQAFKIVVDSWQFTMLLLYILWDHWPIVMISGSNEQLQQQLEYILPEPDCHSWWISTMQSGRQDTLEERYAIELCFKLGKNATETYGMLQTAFGASCLNRAWVFEWHKGFKEAVSVWGMMRGVGGVKKSIQLSWLAKGLDFGLLWWGFKGVQQKIPSQRRGQHSSNRLSGISTRTMHQSTTPSLS